MRTVVGALFLLAAVAGLAVGGLWAFMKAAGAEVDWCNRGDCTSGYYGAGAILLVAVIVGAIGVALLRGNRRA